MDDFDAAVMERRLAQIGVPSQLIERVAALAAPQLRLIPAALDGPPALSGSSKLGGLPDLPRGTAWPKRDPYRYHPSSRRDDEPPGPKPLSFVAQINLREAATAGGAGFDLPAEGVLSIFYDAITQPWGFDPCDGVGLSILLSDETGLERLGPPVVLPEEAIFRERQITMMRGFSVPTSDTFALQTYMATFGSFADLRYAYEDALQAERERAAESEDVAVQSVEWMGHALGGWPSPIQNAMELECQLVSNGIYCGDGEAYKSPDAEALREEAGEWTLLL